MKKKCPDFEADKRAGLMAVALDVRVAGLPELGRGPALLQHRIGEEEPGRFHVGDEERAFVACGDVAGEHHADLVGEDRLALVVHDPAAVAVAVEGEPEIGAVLEHRVARRIQHGEIFGIGVVGGEGVVEAAIERDDRCAEGCEHAGAKAPAVPLPQTTASGAANFGRARRSAR